MPIYSFESSRSIARLAHALVATDTSYMISICVERSPAILQFHRDALSRNTDFAIDSIVRQEFLKKLRKSMIVDAIRRQAAADPILEQRYAALLGKSFRAADVPFTFEKIYKDHVRENDVNKLLGTPGNLADDVEAFERNAKFSYLETSDLEVSLSDIGKMIDLFGMAPTDAMIGAFAFYIGATAIVTTDTDFAQLGNVIDIYMPFACAEKCALYKASPDYP